MLNVCIALNPNSQLLLNQATYPQYFTCAQQDHKLSVIGIIDKSFGMLNAIKELINRC